MESLREVVSRQWTAFRANPVDFLRNKSQRLARFPFEQEAEFGLRRTGCTSLLAKRPADAIPPDYVDLWFLYQSVRRLQPKVVVEFGSGCSTLVLAQALFDNGRAGSADGNLVSLDAEERWAAETAGTIPQHLKPRCEVRHAPVSVRDFDGDRMFVHEGCPSTIPDLVYLDGPALTDAVRGAGDVVLMEERLKPGFQLIVDGRTDNVRMLQRHLKRWYRVRSRPLFANTIFELTQ